jgi:hypothetical protein
MSVLWRAPLVGRLSLISASRRFAALLLLQSMDCHYKFGGRETALSRTGASFVNVVSLPPPSSPAVPGSLPSLAGLLQVLLGRY